MHNENKIDLLLERLNALMQRQEEFTKEIKDIQEEIHVLKGETQKDSKETKQEQESIPEKPVQPIQEKEKELTSDERAALRMAREKEQQAQSTTKIENRPPEGAQSSTSKSDLEKFIGENLINKIGIVITIIGVAIGAKYAIDHDMISPLTRIVLGYIVGGVLLGFALKLKKNYDNFSAVLLSGSMTIMYFITFLAYSLYDLFPQTMAFVLMVVFTAFTVFAAIQYNRQVIAHIGLVGAYAVPFLLSDGSGRIAVLFSYMLIINIGILLIAMNKYWKPLYYVSFGLTWLIYFSWFLYAYDLEDNFALALTFALLFFAVFYLTFLGYKLWKNERFNKADVFMVILNSFIFYAIGYDLLEDHDTGKHLLGLFTLGNSMVHFVVSVVIYKRKLADRNLFYLISGLVLVFLTISIPVQLDGNWVTLLWVGEAALLFWIGRTKNILIYEQLSYPLMLLSTFSIFQDWGQVYNHYDTSFPESRLTPFFNINFLTSALFVAGFAFINWLNLTKNSLSVRGSRSNFASLISYALPSILLVGIFFSFYLEIDNYWEQLIRDSSIEVNSKISEYKILVHNNDLLRFKNLWLIIYGLLFVSLLAFVNNERIKNKDLESVNLVLIIFFIGKFLLQGLWELSELRETYLDPSIMEHYESGVFNIWLRYISILFVVFTLFACKKYVNTRLLRGESKTTWDIMLHTTTLWLISSEFIHWLDMAGNEASYKLILSIVWGVYALFLIVLGIVHKKKHLRIGAIVLFAVTLLKLFFYDISHLGTISKTVVFVSLGVLLLIISFLYNKYKHLIQ